MTYFYLVVCIDFTQNMVPIYVRNLRLGLCLFFLSFWIVEINCKSTLEEHVHNPHNRLIDPYQYKLNQSESTKPEKNVRQSKISGYSRSPTHSKIHRGPKFGQRAYVNRETYPPTQSPLCDRPGFKDYCDQICEVKAGHIECSCRMGFYLLDDNRTCADLDECSLEHFGCSHVCVNTPGSAYCKCPPGYKLEEDEKTCKDIDECRFRNGGCQGLCQNLPGDFACFCSRGFQPDANDKTSCIDINECLTTNGDCSHICTNFNGGHICSCPSGFSLNSDGKTCSDVDECSFENYGCSHRCINTPGSAFCECPQGFEIRDGGKTCKDVDECQLYNGGCQGTCINLPGGFTCTCAAGFVPDRNDKLSCVDVDECSKFNGGCSHNCTNFNGGYYCSCADGFGLGFDGKTCLEIGCPKLLVPSNSKVNCFTKRGERRKPVIRPGKKIDDQLIYSTSVICEHSCQNGFESSQNGTVIECLKNGQWNATLPDCIALSCPPLLLPRHGAVHPSDCAAGNMTVGQMCHFTCEPGFVLKGNYSIKCRRNRTWKGRVDPTCEPVAPYITCQEDVTVELLPSESAAKVTLKKPDANVLYEIHPDWVHLETPVSFPAGKTEVSFLALHHNQSCNVTVTVKDKEAPVFVNCPKSFEVSGASYEGTIVSWTDPIAEDNVGIDMVTQSLVPNSTLIPGHYVADYQAKDFAGNTASCSFEIHVKGNECSKLPDPIEGETNCFDWSVGKICEVSCNPGFSRLVEIYENYDETGIWLPSENVEPCLPDSEYEP